MQPRNWCLVVVIAAAGCVVDPPLPQAKDPSLEELCAPLPEEVRWEAPSMAIARALPVYLRLDEGLYEAPRPVTPGEDEPLWTTPPWPERDRLAEDLGAAISRSLYEWKGARPVVLLERPEDDLGVAAVDSADLAAVDSADLAAVDSADLAADVASVDSSSVVGLFPAQEARRLALCEAATEQGAVLMTTVEVLENTVRVDWHAGFTGLNLFLYWTCGLLPSTLFTPDEEWEVRLLCRVSVHHADSGTLLLQDEYEGVSRQLLNDLERGVTLSGLVTLDPFLLDPGHEDFGQAYAALLPHARRDLERSVLRGLRERLPWALDRAESRALLATQEPPAEPPEARQDGAERR